MFILDNPEFIRHARVQLRHRLLVIILPVLISLVIILAAYGVVDNSYRPDYTDIGKGTFLVFLIFNFFIYYLMNTVLTAISVSSEKSNSTYDFQLMTRLSAFELMIGKLFGAPVVGYVMMGIFTGFSALCILIFGGVSIQVFIVSYVLLITSGILLNAIGLLLSTFFEKMWLFIIIIIGVLILSPTMIFVADALDNYSYDKGVSVVNPFGTITKMWDAQTNFFGLKTPSVLTQPLFYTFLTFTVGLAIVYRIKQALNPFSKYHYLLFMFILQFLILAFIWPPFFNTLGGQGGAYADIETQYNRIDYLQKLSQFLVINMFLIFLTAVAMIQSKADTSVWLRLSPKSFIAKFTHGLKEKAMPLNVTVMLIISSITIFTVAYTMFSHSSHIENNISVFFFVITLFAMFILRELGFFSAMRLTKFGKNVWISVIFLVLFYISASVLTGIFFDDIDGRETLMYSIFPVVSIVGYEELTDIFTGVFVIVLIETIIIYVWLFLGLSKLKQKSMEIAKK